MPLRRPPSGTLPRANAVRPPCLFQIEPQRLGAGKIKTCRLFGGALASIELVEDLAGIRLLGPWRNQLPSDEPLLFIEIDIP